MEIIQKILSNVLSAFYQPFWYAVLSSFLISFFYLYAYNPINTGKGVKIAIKTWFSEIKKSVFFRKLLLLSFLTVMILFRTLLNRNMWENPLSNIMGGWSIFEVDSNGTTTFTTECIENVLLMCPFIILLFWTFKERILKKINFKNVVLKSVLISFFFSFSIELLQLLLRLGTWQLSDLCYNTLGGFLGGIIYYVAYKIKNR
ncbi:MAG: VanZ family protein [Acutalibacteraceae bacterium]